jgi:hypothetical protein
MTDRPLAPKRPNPWKWGTTLLALSALSCGSPSGEFDAVRARGHVEMLATHVGPRPIGTPANAAAREYLTAELGRLGFAVRVQEADAVNPAAGVNAHVFNIIALREGAVSDAIALVSHYDSVAQSPGALDDALGVATSLEAARALAARSLRHSLLVLITDGEEAGLMGARALVSDPDVAGRLRAFLNFDGTGASGPGVLFETGPAWGAPLSAWADAAWRPAGGSFAIEIYRRLPNDTDFTVMQRLGAGLNFAPVGDSYAYHTDRDVADRVRLSTLRHEGENAIAIVRALDRGGLESRADPPTFFSFAGRGGVYGPRVNSGVAWTASAGALAIWFLLTRDIRRRRGWPGLLWTAAWAALAAVVTVAAMIGAVWVLRAVRVERTPWYAAPIWTWCFAVASATAGVRLVGRLAAWVRPAARPDRGPLATWWVTLPLWSALAAVLHGFAPAASFLVAVPLFAAVVALASSGGRHGLMRVASALAWVVAALLWIPNARMILEFVVPLAGWMAIDTPAWFYPALMALIGLMLVPPLGAAVAGLAVPPLLPRIVGAIVLIALVATGAMAYVSPAYTPDRPERRAARYVQDHVQRTAWWEAGSAERALDLGEDRPAPLGWQPVTTAPPSATRVPALGKPFTFRAETTHLVATPPADIRASVETMANGQVRIAIDVRPEQPLLPLQIQVPRAIAPVESSVAGRLLSEYWIATCYGIPLTGTTIRLTLDRPAPELLARASILLTVPGLPGGTGPGKLTPWLSSERSTWTAVSLFVLPLTDGRWPR